MIRLWRPTQEEIDGRLSVSGQPFSYPEEGATADLARLGDLAAAYDVDRHRFLLGTGRDLFDRARRALLAWQHFDIPWLELRGATTPANAGQVVATLTRVCALWFLNPCRVVYTEGTSDSTHGLAFAYGTLPGHVERGEERFAVHFDPDGGEVTYEIVAFSRPAILLSMMGYRWARRIQGRFARSSAAALSRACRAGHGPLPVSHRRASS